MHLANPQLQTLSAEKPNERLFPKVLFLAAPVVVEQLLHSIVGLTDTWLANHLNLTQGLTGEVLANANAQNSAAAAAVGSVAYVLWFVNLLAMSIGMGATALIARATGARHKSLAHAVVGQTLLVAGVVGVVFGALMVLFSNQLASLTGLPADAQAFFADYIFVLGFGVPLALLMMASAACQRGAGDTLSPAVGVMIVDVVNLVVAATLVYGLLGLPKIGFDGIAIGTVCAYGVGAAIQIGLLVRGRTPARLFRHRLLPSPALVKRIGKIGLPSAAELSMQWLANFGVLYMVNKMGNVSAASHLTAIRLEAFSYLAGMGFATAASTLVGQSLGMGDPARARRCGYIAFASGGGMMVGFGLIFIAFGPAIASLMTDDPAIAREAGTCLRIAGFCQSGFAAAMIFSGALRGAGDTLAVMITNLASIIGIRLTSVFVAVEVFDLGLTAVWIVLACELMIRGSLMAMRFHRGRWALAKV